MKLRNVERMITLSDKLRQNPDGSTISESDKAFLKRNGMEPVFPTILGDLK